MNVLMWQFSFLALSLRATQWLSRHTVRYPHHVQSAHYNVADDGVGTLIKQGAEAVSSYDRAVVVTSSSFLSLLQANLSNNVLWTTMSCQGAILKEIPPPRP